MQSLILNWKLLKKGYQSDYQLNNKSANKKVLSKLNLNTFYYSIPSSKKYWKSFFSFLNIFLFSTFYICEIRDTTAIWWFHIVCSAEANLIMATLLKCATTPLGMTTAWSRNIVCFIITYYFTFNTISELLSFIPGPNWLSIDSR